MIISRDTFLAYLTAVDQDGSSVLRLHTTAKFCWLDSGPSLLLLAFYIRSKQKVACQLSSCHPMHDWNKAITDHTDLGYLAMFFKIILVVV